MWPTGSTVARPRLVTFRSRDRETHSGERHRIEVLYSEKLYKNVLFCIYYRNLALATHFLELCSEFYKGVSVFSAKRCDRTHFCGCQLPILNRYGSRSCTARIIEREKWHYEANKEEILCFRIEKIL